MPNYLARLFSKLQFTATYSYDREFSRHAVTADAWFDTTALRAGVIFELSPPDRYLLAVSLGLIGVSLYIYKTYSDLPS